MANESAGDSMTERKPQVGDLVRRRRKPLDVSWMGLVVKRDDDGFIWVRWCDDGTTDDCSEMLMEVVSEGR